MLGLKTACLLHVCKRVELSPRGASCEPNRRFFGPVTEGREAALESCAWLQTLTYDSQYGAAGAVRKVPPRGGIEPGSQDREADAVTTRLNRSGTELIHLK